MRQTMIRCGTCGHGLALPQETGDTSLACEQCRAITRCLVFPALFRPRRHTEAQQIVDEGQSSCMNHPDKTATTVCDSCGKFLCALCDVEWGEEHLCSTCIEHRRSSGDHTLKSEYIHYDRIVFAMTIVSLFVYFLGLLLAPIALYIGWRYWNETWRPVPYRKWGMVVSIVLSFAIMATWGAFFAYFIMNL
jgi:hypothetical protein